MSPLLPFVIVLTALFVTVPPARAVPFAGRRAAGAKKADLNVTMKDLDADNC